MRTIVDDVMEKLPELFSMRELMGKVEERTPYVIVCFQATTSQFSLSELKLEYLQECERMNLLVAEMRRSLKELDLGLKGELTITSDMEDLSDSLFFDQVELSPANNMPTPAVTSSAKCGNALSKVRVVGGGGCIGQTLRKLWAELVNQAECL